MAVCSALARATTRDLVEIVQAGGQDAALAEERLLMANEGLVRSLVRRVTAETGALDEDLLQEARLGLSWALRNYDISAEASLSTYAWAVMYRAVLRAMNRVRSVPSVPLGSIELLKRGRRARRKVNPDQMPLFDEQFAVRDAVLQLDRPDRQLVTSIYWKGESQVAVAAQLSLSHTAIQMRQRRILGKLRSALSA